MEPLTQDRGEEQMDQPLVSRMFSACWQAREVASDM